MPIDRSLLEPVRPGFDPELLEWARGVSQQNAEKDRHRRTAIRDAYVRDLISPFAPVRMQGQRRARKEIIDPIDRQNLVEDVALYGRALESLDRQERSEAGYVGRAAIDLRKSARTAGGAVARSGRSFARLVPSAIGMGLSGEDVKFERALEAKRYGEEPAKSLIDTPGALGSIARGAEITKESVATLAPDMIPGIAALKAGGRGASAAFWASRQFADSYEDLKEMGVSDAKARVIGATIAGGTGLLEQFVPDVTGLVKGKGIVSQVARAASRKATQVVGAGLKRPLAKKAVSRATGVTVRAIGETAEEGTQAAYDEAIKFNVAARDPEIEYRDVADIGRRAWEAMVEAGPGIAAMGGGGGAVQFSGDVAKFKRKSAGLKQSNMETEIMRFAQSGETPSRTQWAKWGGLAEEGFSMKNRKAGVKSIAQNLGQIARVRTVVEGRTPTEQQWKDWGFDPEKGRTPEARKAFLFEKFRKGYVSEQREKVESRLGELQEVANDTVAKAKQARLEYNQDLADFQETEPARPEGNLPAGEIERRPPEALVQKQVRMEELDRAASEAVAQAKQIEADYADFQETQPGRPEDDALLPDAAAVRRGELKTAAELDEDFEAWKAATQPSVAVEEQKGPVTPARVPKAVSRPPAAVRAPRGETIPDAAPEAVSRPPAADLGDLESKEPVPYDDRQSAASHPLRTQVWNAIKSLKEGTFPGRLTGRGDGRKGARTGREENDRKSLQRLRKALPNVPREDFDAAVLEMERRGEIVLVPFERFDIHEDDKAAEIQGRQDKQAIAVKSEPTAEALESQESRSDWKAKQREAKEKTEKKAFDKEMAENKRLREEAEDEVSDDDLLALDALPEAKKETAEERAQREAEEADIAARPELEARGFGLGGGKLLGKRVHEDKIGGDGKVPKLKKGAEENFKNAAISADIQETIADIGREAKEELKKSMFRAQIHLKNNKVNAVFNELFRIQKEVKGNTAENAIRIVSSIVDPLGPNQYDLFSRTVILRNLKASLDRDELFRFGYENKEEVELDLGRLEKVVEATPEVKKALDTREKIVVELVDQLVAAEILPEEAKKHAKTYYHQQVLLYSRAKKFKGDKRTSGDGIKKGAVKKKKGFQEKRIKGKEDVEYNPDFDYSTNYVEADIAWIASAKESLETKKIFNRLMRKGDIRGELEAAAKELGEDASWRDLAKKKEGYVIWRLPPGTIFSTAVGIQDQITEALVREAIDMVDLTDQERRAVIADSLHGKDVVIPEELALQIDASKARVTGPIAKLVRFTSRLWKTRILFSPDVFVSYWLRNVTGDIDVSGQVDPGMARELPQANRELKKYHSKNKGLPISKDLAAARTHGAIGSGFTGTELKSTESIASLRRFFRTNKKARTLLTPIIAYYDWAMNFSTRRENTLRYASFLSAKKQLLAGRAKHYGGSKQEVANAVWEGLGIDAGAAHLSRNLLGDYGNMTVMGQWLSDHMMPFWKFQEISLKRQPRIFINAIKAGQGRKDLNLVSRTAVSALVTSRMAWMYGALWVWNNLVMPGDDGEELYEYDQAHANIRLGKNADGNDMIFRKVGAMSDFLEWFGMNEAISMLPAVLEGQVTWGELGKEMALAGPEKIVGSLRPEIMGTISVLTGLSFFPEPLQPRAIRRGEAASQVVGLTDEWKAIRGIVLQRGERARPHYFQRWVVGISDPRHVALSSMYTAKNRFLKKKGIIDKTIYPVSKYKEARDAAKNEDYDAFVEWKRWFVKGQEMPDAYRKFIGFTKRINPIDKLSVAEQWDFENNFLTSEQRGQLEVSRVYSGELRDRLVAWWEAESREKNSKKK